jgi:hypothetical protein
MGEAKRRRGIRHDPTLASTAQLISTMHTIHRGKNQSVARMARVMEAAEQLVKPPGRGLAGRDHHHVPRDQPRRVVHE